MGWQKIGLIIGAVAAVTGGTAAVLGDTEKILNVIPVATIGYVDKKLAGSLEPLSRSLRVQGIKSGESDINNLEFQLIILRTKKAELDIIQKTDDSKILREAIADIEAKIESTQSKLKLSECDHLRQVTGEMTIC